MSQQSALAPGAAPATAMRITRAKAGARRVSAGVFLVLAASLFNLLLCFLQTRHWASGSSAEVIGCELAILAAGLMAIRPVFSNTALAVSICVVVTVIALKLINPGLDLKIIHDVAITYIFYTLGTLASQETANRLLSGLMIIVLILGFFEFVAPAIYAQVFDIWSYYVAKGTLSQTTVDYAQTNFFLSSARAGAQNRTLLPGLLGPHRASSIFLEPVSMGNFAVITFAWCLCTSASTPWRRFALICGAVLCIILSDSRFGIGCCLIMALARSVPVFRARPVVFLMLVLSVLALTLAGSIHALPGIKPSILGDNLPGRLLFSGRLLNDWTLQNWLGLVVSRVYTSDTGFAYVINNLGLPLSLLLAALFAFHVVRRREAGNMKAMVAVYLSTSLCIGASAVSIKTAALLWFLYGATDSAVALQIPAGPRARMVRSRQPAHGGSQP